MIDWTTIEEEMEYDGKPNLYVRSLKKGASVYENCWDQEDGELSELPDPAECTFVGIQLNGHAESNSLLWTNNPPIVEWLKDWIKQPQQKFLYFSNGPIENIEEYPLQEAVTSRHTMDAEPELIEWILQNHLPGKLHMQIKYKKRESADLDVESWINHTKYNYYKSMEVNLIYSTKSYSDKTTS